jgi:2-polyprenyl-3-methyl-5-hydroxy-6-metoxy-1,4-benzoquinol methylase
MPKTNKITSPDNNSDGFLDHAPETMRYEYASREPDDTAMRLASRILRGSRVLDVGCGTGAITEILRDVTGATVVGIEPDTGRALRAQARGLTVTNDFLSQKFVEEHGLFDFVVFADVIEHLPNPAQIVLLARQALKPGGSILASVPNAAHFYTRLDLLRGIFRYEDCGIMDATHLRWFTRDSLQQFFLRLGFEITHQNYTVMPGMREYTTRRPFRNLKPKFRNRLLRRLSAWKPSLFAVQHIIQATKPRG